MKRIAWFTTWMMLALGFLAMPHTAEAGRLARLAEKLGLSEAQQDQIRKISYKSQREQITLKAQLQIARLDLKQLLDQHKPDLKLVEAAVDKVGKLELALKKMRILMMVEMKAVLTKAQAAKLDKMREMREWRKMKRGRRWMKHRRERMRRMHRPGPEAPEAPEAPEDQKPPNPPR